MQNNISFILTSWKKAPKENEEYILFNLKNNLVARIWRSYDTHSYSVYMYYPITFRGLTKYFSSIDEAMLFVETKLFSVGCRYATEEEILLM